MNAPEKAKLLTILAENWQTEVEGYYTYNALAAVESDPQRRGALRGLAASEKHHADMWSQRSLALGGMTLVYRGRTFDDGPQAIAQLGGSRLALRRLEVDESRDIAAYRKQLEALQDEPTLQILREVIEDEQEHYRVLSSLLNTSSATPPSSPENARTALADLLTARNKGTHVAAGWVGDAIYGINDGLGSIFGIVSGVAGATVGNSHFVLIAGLAGMIASALSMGSGAYLAAKSEREIFAAAFERERESVFSNEPEAREILSLIYQSRGFPENDADRFVAHLACNKDELVSTLARERLNTTEEALRDPWTAAFSGALSTAIGAFIPIIPFFFLAGMPAVLVAAGVSLAAHFAVGAAKSLITIRTWWSGGFEMTAVGALEGIVTYAVGLGLAHIGGG